MPLTEAQHMTIGCSPHLRHWAPIRRLHGSMVCQHLKAQTASALRRENTSAFAPYVTVNRATCIHALAFPSVRSIEWYEISWPIIETPCSIISPRETEAVQELADGNSDTKGVLRGEHGRLSELRNLRGRTECKEKAKVGGLIHGCPFKTHKQNSVC